MIVGCRRRINRESSNANDCLIAEDTSEEATSADVESLCSSVDLQVAAAVLDDEGEDDNLEPWPDFIRRATRDAEARLEALKLDDWITLQRKVKMRLISRWII